MEKSFEIAIMAHYPVNDEVKDGMYIRIKAIDTIFKNKKRCYIESLCSPINKLVYFLARDIKRGKLFESLHNDEKLKSLRYIRKSRLKEIFINADIIYVQTWSNLCKIPEDLMKEFGHKIFFDIHGCFLEEMEYNNVPNKYIKKALHYEKLAFNNIKNFVCVSQKMIDFYKQKYPVTQNVNYVKLPIFSLNESSSYEKTDCNKLNIIYSGRNNKWQNVSAMMHTISQIKNNQNFDIKILTPDIDEFKREAEKFDIRNLKIESKLPFELVNEYKQAHLGFILREDNIVNTVACPTKLVEYMENGIIPIVLQPEIGDFNAMGYKYILNRDLVDEKIPSKKELEEMRIINYNIIKQYYREVTAIKGKFTS